MNQKNAHTAGRFFTKHKPSDVAIRADARTGKPASESVRCCFREQQWCPRRYDQRAVHVYASTTTKAIPHRPYTAYILSKKARNEAKNAGATTHPPRSCQTKAHRTSGYAAAHTLSQTNTPRTRGSQEHYQQCSLPKIFAPRGGTWLKWHRMRETVPLSTSCLPKRPHSLICEFRIATEVQPDFLWGASEPFGIHGRPCA